MYLQIRIYSTGNRMTQSSGLMQGKRGVIFGVANNHVDSGYRVVGMKRPAAPDISLAKE